MISFSPTTIGEYFDRLPTTDLYFLNPLAELRRMGANVAARPVSPNVHLVGRTAVIVRYGRAKDLERVRRLGAQRIVYIVDDDLHAGGADPALPEPYRMKLRNFAERDWPALKSAADIVVTPGSVLAETYGPKARVIPPAWDLPPASSDHFDTAEHIDLVHLGTGSHRSDLDMIAAPLARLLDRHPTARLTLFAGETAPGALRSHRHVRLRHPMSWWRYKRALPKMRFHIAVYPLASSPFNRARSANKLYEHAIVGAASLMTPNPALRAAAGPDVAQAFIEGDADIWEERIAVLLESPEAARRQVEATRAHIEATNPLASSAEQWREILAPEL